MTKRNNWLILPIETKVRELYGKLLFSFVAAEVGFIVIIGPKAEINNRSEYFPKGFILNFGLAKSYESSSRLYKKYGHKVIAIDEEGLVTLNDDIYLKYRVSEDTLKQTDLFFCWGDRQASLVKSKAVGTGCQVISSGNPRFDILRPEYKSILNEMVSDIKSKFGPMILINSNFGSFNHVNGVEYTIKSLRDKQWMTTPEDEKYHLDRINLQGRFFDYFVNMLPILSSEFKTHNIVLRPHPSENQDVWKEHAKNLPNVHIIHDGNVDPWIMASDLVIHNGCTTAVQAFLLGKPVISYRPFIIKHLETSFPNELSDQVQSLDGLIERINEIISGSVMEPDLYKNKLADQYIAARNGWFASEKIVKTMIESYSPLSIKNLFLGSEPALKTVGSLFSLREFINELFKKNLDRRHYLKHKFSGLYKDEIYDVLHGFNKIGEYFQRISVINIGQSCFIIKKGT
jgi:surface carbohydrate biosynthesis protein